MRSRVVIVAVLVAAGLAGAGLAIIWMHKIRPASSDMQTPSANVGAGLDGDLTPVKGEESEGDPMKSVVVNVAIAKIEIQPLTEHLTLPAVAEAWQDVSISSELGGKLVWIGVKEGDRVKAGGEIARIDAEDLEVATELAEADRAFAKSDFKRVESLRTQGVASAEEMDRASIALAAAKARHDAALVTLRRATIRSSIDGIVDDVAAEIGEYVSPGDLVARVVAKDRLKIVARLPERDVRYVEPETEVLIFPEISTNPAYPGPAYPGKVLYVSQTASPETRTYRLEVVYDNARDLLRPGMIVKIRFARRQFSDTIVVPLFCVIASKEGRFVFVEEEGVAHRRRVELGIFEGVRVQIRAGLVEGDNLVVSGHRQLTDGDRVRIVEVIHGDEALPAESQGESHDDAVSAVRGESEERE